MPPNQGRGSDSGRWSGSGRDSDTGATNGGALPSGESSPTTRAEGSPPSGRSGDQIDAGRSGRSLDDDRSGGPLDGHRSGRSGSIETADVSATLLAVPDVEIGDLVYDYQLDGSVDPAARRPLVLFDVENTGSEPLRWNPARTRFVGDDDYTYRASSLSLDPEQFGPGCHTRQVTIEPGRRARIVTLTEELPAGVAVEEVVHSIPTPGSAGRTRVRVPLE